jgi:acrylyl-CoA reductase (NADPH)
MNQAFKCFLVEKDEAGQVRRGIVQRTVADLPPGDVVIRVRYSSLNYKDALAAQAHPGVVRRLPHVPGIDAAGVVEQSTNDAFRPGDEVVVTGNELGAGHWGGWSELIRVPAAWIVPRPTGLSLKETMILGTAGFTAAQCVEAIRTNGVEPSAGEIVVTGATGGVGCLAVRLLSRLGYAVVAVTGKAHLEQRLKSWGAARVIGRGEVLNPTDRPLLSARWAGGVDTVGGDALATLVRETKPYGVISACGLVGGDKLPLTVHPFILRGVTLAGIGSALLPYPRRLEIWRKLSSDWKLVNLEELATTIQLPAIEEHVEQILRGEIVGRTVIDMGGGSA